ncbi:unnamed protein product [Caenorhabditis brenneri]
MCLPKRYLSAEFRIDRYSKVATRHGTEARHFRHFESSLSGIPCLIGDTYAEVLPQSSRLFFDINWMSDKRVALGSFISHINICWNSPRISIKIVEDRHFEHFLSTMRYFKLNSLVVDSVDLTNDVWWKFDEHFLQCKSIKLYFHRFFEYHVFKVQLVNFLEMLVNYPENHLEVIRIIDCGMTIEVITNGLNEKGIVHEVVESNLELQRCDGKKMLISSVHKVLEVKVVKLVNFLEMLVNYSENELEVIRILDCKLTVEVITNGLNKKGIVHEKVGSNLEMQRCDGKKILISLVDQVLEVKVV